MTGPAERLATLGLALPPVTAPVAAYVPALRTGAYVYVSGQVPVADGKLLGTGKVGAGVSVTEAAISNVQVPQLEESSIPPVPEVENAVAPEVREVTAPDLAAPDLAGQDAAAKDRA